MLGGGGKGDYTIAGTPGRPTRVEGEAGTNLFEKQDSDTIRYSTCLASRVESSRCEIATGRDKEPLRLTTKHVCVSELDEEPPFVTGTASSKQLRVVKDRETTIRPWSSVPKRLDDSKSIFFFLSRGMFLYTLLPIPGKTTRPGVLDRNYDLDARCVSVSVRPPRNPGRPTNHHAPCSLPHAAACPCQQQPMREGWCMWEEAAGSVRYRSGRHHSAARICLS